MKKKFLRHSSDIPYSRYSRYLHAARSVLLICDTEIFRGGPRADKHINWLRLLDSKYTCSLLTDL